MKVSASFKPKDNTATLQELADHMFTKKLGLSIPEHSPNSFRVMAARAKRMPKIHRHSENSNPSSKLDLKETSKKIRDLTAIESQYSKYLMKFKSHDQFKDQKHVSQSFWTFIQDQPISLNTKERLALKLKSPFRINLSEFGNKSLNVKKYISLLDSSDAKAQTQPQETDCTVAGINQPSQPASDADPLKQSLTAAKHNTIRLFPRDTPRDGSQIDNRARSPGLLALAAKQIDGGYYSGSPRSQKTTSNKFFKSQAIGVMVDSSAARIYPTPSRPTPKTGSAALGSGYLSSRSTKTNSARFTQTRTAGLSRRSPDATSRYELAENVDRPGTRESTWRPSFMQINPQKALLKDKLGHVMHQCDQMHQTGSSWMQAATLYKGAPEKSVSRSSTPAYFKPTPYMLVKQKRRAEPSTQAEFSSFTPERSSPTEARGGLEQAIKLRIAQRAAQQDAELAVRRVERQVELEMQQAEDQLHCKEPKLGKPQRPLLKKSGTIQGFSPRNNSPDNDLALQANMLHNLISFGHPNATKQEVVERMLEFKDVAGRKLAQSDVQMLAETRHFFITNSKTKKDAAGV